MFVRALIVAAALGAGATTYVVLDGHGCDGHDEDHAACACRHDMSLVECGASIEVGCCCCLGAPTQVAVPAAELLRPDDAPATALPADFHARFAWPPDELSPARFGSARAPPAESLLAQRTSFLC